MRLHPPRGDGGIERGDRSGLQAEAEEQDEHKVAQPVGHGAGKPCDGFGRKRQYWPVERGAATEIGPGRE